MKALVLTRGEDQTTVSGMMIKTVTLSPQVSAPMNTAQELKEDLELFDSWRGGDMNSFDQLYQRYRQSLFIFLTRRGHSQAEAEEIFHDCWMRVINKQGSFSGDHFKAWLFTIARNLSTDHMRKFRPDPLNESAEDSIASFSTERVQEAVDCLQLIKQSVASLPMEQRDVFLLQHEAGLSLQQIADLMRVGRETIKSRIRYAMDKLRDLMAECL